MNSQETTLGLLSVIRATNAWNTWKLRYSHQLIGLGDEPTQTAEARLAAIRPDTYKSLMLDLQQGDVTLPFSSIVSELLPNHVEAVLEDYSPLAHVAIMQFFLKK